MSIDLFTFIVQIINFLLLLFLLSKFLYKPIINTINERKKYIKTSIEDAEKELKEAEEANNKYQSEIEKIDKYKKNQKEKIDSEILEYKKQKTEEVELEIGKIKEEFLRQFDEEKSTIADNIAKNILLNISDFLKDTFVSLTNNSLENAALNKFIDEINNFSHEVIKRINNETEKQIKFISSFELDVTQKELIRKTFTNKGVDNNKEIVFIQNEDVILGNKITIGSLTINSNVRNIIYQFQEKLEQIM